MVQSSNLGVKLPGTILFEKKNLKKKKNQKNKNKTQNMKGVFDCTC